MDVTRRNLAIAGAVALGAASLLGGSAVLADASDEAAVKDSVEALRKALLMADKAQLEALAAAQLSYGHSSGKVQNKAEFVDGVDDPEGGGQVAGLSRTHRRGGRRRRDRPPSLRVRTRKPTANPTIPGSACSRSGKSRTAAGSCWRARPTS